MPTMKKSDNLFVITGNDYDLILNLHRGNITVQQKWKYEWVVPTASTGQKLFPPWTLKEKRAFHQSCDESIWEYWSHRFFLCVDGDGSFARKFKDKPLPLNFDVRWVTAQEHYTCYATKGDHRYLPIHNREFVSGRKIYLAADSNEMRFNNKLRGGINANTPQGMQNPTAHEFGHSMGLNPDEYKPVSVHYDDLNSMMHSGWALRGRHIKRVMDQLNGLTKDMFFSITEQR